MSWIMLWPWDFWWRKQWILLWYWKLPNICWIYYILSEIRWQLKYSLKPNYLIDFVKMYIFLEHCNCKTLICFHCSKLWCLFSIKSITCGLLFCTKTRNISNECYIFVNKYFNIIFTLYLKNEIGSLRNVLCWQIRITFILISNTLETRMYFQRSFFSLNVAGTFFWKGHE